MNIKSFAKRLQRLEQHSGFEKPTDILSSPEWLTQRTIIVEAAAPYPDADMAFTHAVCKIERLQRPSWDKIHSLIAQALEPFLDVRIVVAEKLMEEAHRNA